MRNRRKRGGNPRRLGIITLLVEELDGSTRIRVFDGGSVVRTVPHSGGRNKRRGEGRGSLDEVRV